MARRGYTEEQIEAMKEAFKRLFRENGGSITQRMRSVLDDLGEHASVEHLCEAIAASAQGKHGRSHEKK
jgi:acyl-[acyl carrier protein]--UDP-N-acetylglucosamine O-acyltransferase